MSNQQSSQTSAQSDNAPGTPNGRWRLDGSWEYHRPKNSWPRWLKRLIAVLAAFIGFYALLVFGAFAFQNNLIYFPDRRTPPPASEVLATAQDITLQTADGLELGAWWVTPPAHIERREQVVLYAGGNAGNREGRSQLAFFLALRGFDVLSFDYRGFGGNPGTPSEQGLALDAQAALAAIHARGYANHQIIYFGESLGAAVVARLAVTDPPAAVILRSPFDSLDAVARWHFPFLPTRLILRDHYPVAAQMPDIQAPVLVLYGMSDRTVPRIQSIAVAEAAPTLWRSVPFLGAGHNDSLWWGMRIVDLVESMADAVG